MVAFVDGVSRVAPLVAAVLPRSLGPYLALMFAGFVVGVLGHLTRARWLVAVGVIMVFLATLLFPLAANLTEEDRPAVPDYPPTF